MNSQTTVGVVRWRTILRFRGKRPRVSTGRTRKKEVRCVETINHKSVSRVLNTGPRSVIVLVREKGKKYIEVMDRG